MTGKDEKPRGSDPAPGDVGAQLKRRRTLRGQTIEAVHQHTRIPREHLEALEANDLDHFPAAVYMRGFLRSYCDYLDLDGAALLAQLEEASPKGERRERSVETPDASGRGAPLWLPISESTLLPVLLIGGLAAAGGLLWAFKTRAPETGRSARHAAETPAHAAGVAVRIEALESVQLELTAEGEPVFEGRLAAGQSASFTGKEFVLTCPRPERLKVTVDGREAAWNELPGAGTGSARLAPPAP